MKTTADKILLTLTALCVGGLAIAAGAISFAHMRELATHHDQLGWKSYTFPISVDGLEIVASLFLVTQRRAGRPTGWIPWMALTVGTLASLAANVAVGGDDPIGKALAGWPALSMLVSVKLLFSMLDHDGRDQRTAGPADQRTARTVRQTGQNDSTQSGTVASERTDTPAPSPGGPAGWTSEDPDNLSAGAQAHADGQSERAGPLDIRTVSHLIPAARMARAALARNGQPLSRDSLADAMRENGKGVSNQRASLLLKLLKAEQDVPAVSAASVRPRPKIRA